MKHKTNTEFLTDLMEFSRTGPLMQVFILTAVVDVVTDLVAAGWPKGGKK